jgi:heat shock protein HspQ
MVEELRRIGIRVTCEGINGIVSLPAFHREIRWKGFQHLLAEYFRQKIVAVSFLFIGQNFRHKLFSFY